MTDEILRIAIMTEKIRVAAAQFATGIDIESNLQTCLRMIDSASECQPDILVLPEFCNHASWYENQDHAYAVAVELEGYFTRAIGQKAKALQCYIMLNCTVRHDEPQVTGSNILFDPNGDIIAVSDKQVLMGNENNFLTKASEICPIVETPFGKIGMYSCMDGVIFETPRGLALRGAQILLNSLNSFADDEASLHIPVRAAENKVFVVAANKIGSLVPEALATVIAERVKIAPEQLHGAGESQIVAPDGSVLAKAPRTGEAVIYADIQVSRADHKLRPDGTHILNTRRPTLYKPLSEKPSQREYSAGVDALPVAVYQPVHDGAEAIDEVLNLLPAINQAKMLVLPELCHIPHRSIKNPNSAQVQSQEIVDAVVEKLSELNSDLLVCTSIVSGDTDGYALTGVLISQEGIVFQQVQLHNNAYHAQWQSKFGDSLKTFDAPFGRIAIAVGDDSNYPELFRLMAVQNVEIVLVPTHISEAWEVETGLRERAAENRMNLVVASRQTEAGSSLILGIDEDFTLWTEWKKRPFDGNINYPIVTPSRGNGLLLGTIYPASAGNRLVSQQTDVVDSRPYWLLDALVE